MKKFAICLVLLGLGSFTFVGCGKDASKPIPTKPDTTETETTPDEGTGAAAAPAGDETKADEGAKEGGE